MMKTDVAVQKLMAFDVYDALVDAGCLMDHHESDLYVPVTPESSAVMRLVVPPTTFSRFRSDIDGSYWYEVPFGYKPFWESAAKGE